MRSYWNVYQKVFLSLVGLFLVLRSCSSLDYLSHRPIRSDGRYNPICGTRLGSLVIFDPSNHERKELGSAVVERLASYRSGPLGKANVPTTLAQSGYERMGMHEKVSEIYVAYGAFGILIVTCITMFFLSLKSCLMRIEQGDS